MIHRNIRVPNDAENRALVERAKNGDASARDELVERNLPFVAMLARELWDASRVRTRRMVSVDDAISYGVIGLIESIDYFDPSNTNRFITYAAYWIKNEVWRGFGVTDLIRIPHYLTHETQVEDSERRRKCRLLARNSRRIFPINSSVHSIHVSDAESAQNELDLKLADIARKNIDLLPEKNAAIIHALFFKKWGTRRVMREFRVGPRTLTDLINCSLTMLRRSIEAEAI